MILDDIDPVFSPLAAHIPKDLFKIGDSQSSSNTMKVFLRLRPVNTYCLSTITVDSPTNIITHAPDISKVYYFNFILHTLLMYILD
jgi:hypothetical protein